MKSPEWVFLDLDNTLWDFDGNAEEALGELFHRHHLHLKSGFSVHEFVALYKTVNAEYWRRYENGEIEKDFLRTARFTDTFSRMGIPDSEHPENIWQEYLQICPLMSRMIPGAELLLEICSENAQAALITNGFAQTQAVKVTHTGIADKIQFMITSEDAGFAKPDVRIFQSALQRAGVEKDAAIYIGDTFDTDIKGGMAAGLRVLWFNPQGLPLDPEVAESPLFLGEFRSLIELIAFLGEKWTWE